MFSKFAKPQSHLSSKSTVIRPNNATLIPLLNDRIKILEAELSQQTLLSPSEKSISESRRSPNKNITNTTQGYHEFNFILPEDIAHTNLTIASKRNSSNYHTLSLFFDTERYHQQMVIDPIFGQLYQNPTGRYCKKDGILYFSTEDITHEPIKVIPCSMLVILIETFHYINDKHISNTTLKYNLPSQFKVDYNHFEAALKVVRSRCLECQNLQPLIANTSRDETEDDTNFLIPENIFNIVSDPIFGSEFGIPYFFSVELYSQEIRKDPTFGKPYRKPTKNFLQIGELLFQIVRGQHYLVIPDTMLYLLLRAKHFDIQGHHTSSIEMSKPEWINYAVTKRYYQACNMLLSNCSLCQNEYNKPYQEQSEDDSVDSDMESSTSEPPLAHINETNYCEQQNSDNESISQVSEDCVSLEMPEDLDWLRDNLIEPVSIHMQMDETEVASFYENQMKIDTHFSKIYQNPPENYCMESIYLTYVDNSVCKIVTPDKIIGILLQIHHSNFGSFHIPTEFLQSLLKNYYWFNHFDFKKHLNEVKSTCPICRNPDKSETPSEKDFKSEETSVITDRTSVGTHLEESTPIYQNKPKMNSQPYSQNVETSQPDVRIDELSPHTIHKQDDMAKIPSFGNSDHLIRSTDISQMDDRSNETTNIIPAGEYQLFQNHLLKQPLALEQIDERSFDDSDFSKSQKQLRFNNFQKTQQYFKQQNKSILDLIDKKNQLKSNRIRVEQDPIRDHNTNMKETIRHVLRSHANKMPEVFYYAKRSKPNVEQSLFDEMRYAIKLIAEKNFQKTFKTKPPTSSYKIDQTNSPNDNIVMDNSNSSINENSNIDTDEIHTSQTEDSSDPNSETTTMVKTNLLNDDTIINTNFQCTNNNGLRNDKSVTMSTKFEPIITRHPNLNDKTVINSSNNQTITDITPSHTLDTNTTQPESNVQLLQTNMVTDKESNNSMIASTMQVPSTPDTVSVTSSCDNLSISNDSGIEVEYEHPSETTTTTQIPFHESHEIVNDLLIDIITTICTSSENMPLDNQSSKKPLGAKIEKIETQQRPRSNSI